MTGPANRFGRKVSKPAEKVDALGLVLQDELRTLHAHVTKGTDYQAILFAVAYSPNGTGVSVRKGNIERTDIGRAVIKTLRMLADDMEKML